MRKVETIFDTGSGRVLQSNYLVEEPETTIQDVLEYFAKEHHHTVGASLWLEYCGMVSKYEMHNRNAPLMDDDEYATVIDFVDQVVPTDHALVFGQASLWVVLGRILHEYYKMIVPLAIFLWGLWMDPEATRDMCIVLLVLSTLAAILFCVGLYVFVPINRSAKKAYGETCTDIVIGALIVCLACGFILK